MCGLCGILHLDGTPVRGAHDAAPPDVLAHMTARLTHRGPDQGRTVDAGACGLGNRRLAILDLSPGGALPMQSRDESITLAYNGEVYNYPALRESLMAAGVAFRTGSDAEAVIALYQQHGPDFLTHLRGMFALAVWDAPRQRLVLARDRLGQKPLYYWHDARRLIFASEIKALLAHPAVPRRPALEHLPLLLAYGYVPAPHTLFEGIRMLLPGHRLIAEAGRLHIEPYWTPPPTAGIEPHADPAAYMDELRATFDDAVRLRLLSDVPLGAFLSGGLDSSLIVAAMQRHTATPVKTFAIGFSGEPSYDETAHARRVAAHLGTDHHEFIVAPDAIQLLPFLVWHHDQPFADSSAIPTYLVSQHTRDHVTVALTGDGGDELFAGYERFYAARLAGRFHHLPAPLWHGLRRALRLLPEATSYRGIVRRARRFVDGVAQDPVSAYFSWVRLFDDAQIAALLASPGTAAPDTATPAAHFAARFRAADPRDFVAQLLDVNLATYLPDDLLIKADRASMAASLEARAPFLDHHLVELAARIPLNLKLRGSTTKFILKELARGLLPDDIIDRPKHGFGVPLGRWFREDLHAYARATLLDEPAAGRGLFNPAAVAALLDEHARGQRDHGQRIWLLLTIEWWWRLFIDADTPHAP